MSEHVSYQITGNMLTSTPLHFTRKRPLSIDVVVECHVLYIQFESVDTLQNNPHHECNGNKKGK